MGSFHYIFLKNVLGEFAKWAVIQSPYFCPEKLQEAINAIAKISFPFFQDGTSHYKMWRCTEAMFLNYTERIKEIPEIAAWGKPKVDSGVEMIVVSRYGGPLPDSDCIDLDALMKNITREIFDDAQESNL